MNRVLLLCVYMTLVMLSCSDSHYSGGATDIGNGYVAGSFTTEGDGEILVSLSKKDYYKADTFGTILYDTLKQKEMFSFENLDSGEYILWAGNDSLGQLIKSGISVNNDSTVLENLELQPLGSLTFTSDYFDSIEVISGLYIAGTDKEIKIEVDTNGGLYADSLPAGTYDVFYFEKNGQVYGDADIITVIPETVVEKTDAYNLMQLAKHPKCLSANIVKEYSDTLWCGTNNGLGFYVNKEWNFESSLVNELTGVQVHDIISFQDTLFLATNKGLLKREALAWVPLYEGDTVLELLSKGDSLYFLNTNSVYCYANGTTQSLHLDTLWNPVNSLTTFTLSSSGDIWVGTNQKGVYRHSVSGWEKVSEQLGWEGVRHNRFSTDSSGVLWLASDGMGFYYYQNDFWSRAPMESDSGHIKDIKAIGDSSMIAVSYDGTFTHNVNGFSEIVSITFNADTEIQVHSISVNAEDKVFITSSGQGVYTLELY